MLQQTSKFSYLLIICVFLVVPSNVSDVNHSVVIVGEDTVVKITFQVSPGVPHHIHGYTCESIQANDSTV